MVNNLVPDSNHISRFCRIRGIGETGRITGAAFLPRKKSEKSHGDFVDGQYRLSVNWLDYLKLPNQDDQINEIRKVYKVKLPHYFFNGEPKIAVLKVGSMRGKVLKVTHRDIMVEHKRTDGDPSHSRVSGEFKLDDKMIFDLLATECIEKSYPANSP